VTEAGATSEVYFFRLKSMDGAFEQLRPPYAAKSPEAALIYFAEFVCPGRNLVQCDGAEADFAVETHSAHQPDRLGEIVRGPLYARIL
jgi:hypothetical protein